MLAQLRLICDALAREAARRTPPAAAAPPPLAAAARALATHGVAAPGPKGGAQRFYKVVGVREAPDQSGFQVTLDGRLLNTPGRRPLLVPTRALATAIAAEWEWQAGRLDASTMPLTSLAATALDEPQPRETVIAAMLSYLPTDPVVCRAEAGPVAARQERLLGPLLRWLRGATGAALEPSDSIFGAALPADEVKKVGAHLAGLSRWELAAAEQAAAAGKSVALGLALAAGALDAAAALAAARVEEDVQIEAWGLVEGGHDVDVADLSVRLAAPALFVRLLRDGGGG